MTEKHFSAVTLIKEVHVYKSTDDYEHLSNNIREVSNFANLTKQVCDYCVTLYIFNLLFMIFFEKIHLFNTKDRFPNAWLSTD